MRGLLSWFVVQLMPAFCLIDSELTCWGLLDVHSPEGGPSNPPLGVGWGVLPALKVPAT